MTLKRCPSSPNCISSQADPADRQHYMAPVEVSGSADDVLDVVQDVLDETPAAMIQGRSRNRIDSVFTTRIFRFKDDVSFLVEDGKLHFRSASRLGNNDLGANRKRLTALIPRITGRL